MDIKRNITLLMDFYELTMSNGYFINNLNPIFSQSLRLIKLIFHCSFKFPYKWTKYY